MTLEFELKPDWKTWAAPVSFSLSGKKRVSVGRKPKTQSSGGDSFLASAKENTDELKDHYMFEHTTISRVHGYFELDSDGFAVFIDNDSKNGSGLNDKRLEPNTPQRILSGDVLKLAHRRSPLSLTITVRRVWSDGTFSWLQEPKSQFDCAKNGGTVVSSTVPSPPLSPAPSASKVTFVSESVIDDDDDDDDDDDVYPYEYGNSSEDEIIDGDDYDDYDDDDNVKQAAEIENSTHLSENGPSEGGKNEERSESVDKLNIENLVEPNTQQTETRESSSSSQEAPKPALVSGFAGCGKNSDGTEPEKDEVNDLGTGVKNPSYESSEFMSSNKAADSQSDGEDDKVPDSESEAEESQSELESDSELDHFDDQAEGLTSMLLWYRDDDGEKSQAKWDDNEHEQKDQAQRPQDITNEVVSLQAEFHTPLSDLIAKYPNYKCGPAFSTVDLDKLDAYNSGESEAVNGEEDDEEEEEEEDEDEDEAEEEDEARDDDDDDDDEEEDEEEEEEEALVDEQPVNVKKIPVGPVKANYNEDEIFVLSSEPVALGKRKRKEVEDIDLTDDDTDKRAGAKPEEAKRPSKFRRFMTSSLKYTTVFLAGGAATIAALVATAQE